MPDTQLTTLAAVPRFKQLSPEALTSLSSLLATTAAEPAGETIRLADHSVAVFLGAHD